MIVSVVITRKTRLVILFGTLLLCTLLLVHLFACNSKANPTAGRKRLVPIYFVDTTEKKIAISFDASWGNEYTEQILAILKEHELKTTFFLTGFWIEKYPELVKKIAAEGHELGNHTWTHPHLNSLDKQGITHELKQVHTALTDLWGQEPTVFRPPFGEYSDKVIEAATELNYLTIQWSVDSLDWKDLSQGEIVTRVTGKLHPGAIVLFHNNGRYTAEALPGIIAFAKENGYEIVPISQLLYKDNYYIDSSNGAQKKR